MTALIVTAIGSPVLLIVVVLLVIGMVTWEAHNAPEGWEDEQGFHEGKPR